MHASKHLCVCVCGGGCTANLGKPGIYLKTFPEYCGSTIPGGLNCCGFKADWAT